MHLALAFYPAYSARILSVVFSSFLKVDNPVCFNCTIIRLVAVYDLHSALFLATRTDSEATKQALFQMMQMQQMR